MKHNAFSVNKTCMVYEIYLITLLILPRKPNFGFSYERHDVQTIFTLEEGSAAPYDE